MRNMIREPVPTPWLVLAAVTLFGCGGAAGDDPIEDDHDDEAPAGVEIVELDSLALSMAGIELGQADTVSSARLEVTGTITYDQNRVSHVGPRTEGRIRDLLVDLGARLRKGQVLAVLESPSVGATRADLHEAEALVEIARENFAREERLEAQGIASRKELLDAQADLRRAEAALQKATEQLSALGAEHGKGSEFTVSAPFDGIVVEKHATMGEVVGPSDQLFTVADLGRLWIELDIYERSLVQISEGLPVTVTTAAYPEHVFNGRIVYLGDILDLETRTVRARVEVENTDRLLKPGMFARASVELAEGVAIVVVPREAVQTIEGRTIVWIPGDEPGHFFSREVEVGQTRADGRIEVLAGLEPGLDIVVVGAFTLKAELSKEDFGGHGH
ncbi:MAG: efflux RND transporter periplasmic adaptor subunit [Gemmatimonadota bacterium]